MMDRRKFLKSTAAAALAGAAASCTDLDFFPIPHSGRHLHSDDKDKKHTALKSTSLLVASDRHEMGKGNNLPDLLQNAIKLDGDYVGGFGNMTPEFTIKSLYDEVYSVFDVPTWDYQYYDDIKDLYVPKFWVDGDRNKLVGIDAAKTWNAVTNDDCTEGYKGAVTAHTNDSKALNVMLCSKAKYGDSDETYVYQIQKYDSVEGITYYGKINYVVRARPADAVIELAPVDAKVGDTKVAADFANKAKVDSYKLTLDGSAASGAVSCNFGYSGGEETTTFSLPLNKAGKWELTVKTHFAGVGYTFVIPINVK